MSVRTIKGGVTKENADTIIETVSSTLKRIIQELPDGSTVVVSIDSSDPDRKVISKEVIHLA